MSTNLDDPCPDCDRPIGGHTVEEWFAHMTKPGEDLRYEDNPTGPVYRDGDQTTPLADHLTCSALVLEGGPNGPMPAVKFEFSTRSGGKLVPVGSVVFIGSEVVIRKIGKLVRDTSNGAINAVNRVKGRLKK